MYDYSYGYDYGYDYGYEIGTAATGLAAFGVGLLVFGLIGMAMGILTIIATWKVFTKAGKPGWAAIIPVYNIIVMLEIAELPMWYIALYFVPGANIYAMIKINIEIAKKFGKSAGFGVGMALLPPVFLSMLAFSKKVSFGGVQQTNEQPVAPVEQQVTPFESIVPPVTPVSSFEQPVAPVENIVSTVAPVEQQVTPFESIVPPVAPVSSFEQPVAPVENIVSTVAPVEQQVTPFENTVPPVAPVSSFEQPIQQSTPAFCTNCGSALIPNARFCTNCGKQM